MFSKIDGRGDRECSRNETAMMQGVDTNTTAVDDTDKDLDLVNIALKISSESWSAPYTTVAAFIVVSQTQSWKDLVVLPTLRNAKAHRLRFEAV
jgi:hypothetical protein